MVTVVSRSLDNLNCFNIKIGILKINLSLTARTPWGEGARVGKEPYRPAEEVGLRQTVKNDDMQGA